jgi:hypothetical protein
MELFGLVVSVVALILIGIGIAVGLVASVLVAALLGLGVLSSSFLIGFRSGRPAAGIRAFLLMVGILAGIPAGAVCAWLAHAFFNAYGNDVRVLFFGALGGGIAGVVLALMVDFVSRRVYASVSARLRLPSENERKQRGEIH